MRRAGELINRSDSYILQIENGRMDVPDGDILEKMLEVYDGPNLKSFKERARIYKQKLTPREELSDLLKRLNDDKVPLVLQVLKGLLG
jgi:transcriptional regulator with XRE-family HTH domain